MPGRVRGEGGVRVERNQAEVRGRDLPFAWIAVGLAERLELLEVREVAHVEALREVAADGALERLAARELAARQAPLVAALAEQHAQPALADLEDGGEGDVAGAGGRIGHGFRPAV
jgi:hypothetical protein